MELYKCEDCMKTLTTLFERGTNDFNFASKLCDLLSELEKQRDKYNKLKQGVINKYYEYKGDTYEIRDRNNLLEVNDTLLELNKLTFPYEKKQLSPPEYISPKELCYLREFFLFE
jgi:hypothetical protein